VAQTQTQTKEELAEVEEDLQVPTMDIEGVHQEVKPQEEDMDSRMMKDMKEVKADIISRKVMILEMISRVDFIEAGERGRLLMPKGHLLMRSSNE